MASAAKIAVTTKDVAFLEQARQIAEEIFDDLYKPRALSALATSAAKMGKWSRARAMAESNVTDAGKAEALAAMLKVWGERQYPALAETAAEEE